MRSQLPTITALKCKSADAKIIDLALTDDGLTYIYEIEFDVNLNAYINNNIASVRARALSSIPSKSKISLEKAVSKKIVANGDSTNTVQIPSIEELQKSGNATPSLTGDDAMGKYVVKSDSNSKQQSKTTTVGNSLITLSFDLMSQYASFQKAIENVTIAKTMTSFETEISSTLSDLIKQIGAAANTNSASNKTTKRSFGLTGKISAKKKRITIPEAVSQDFDFVPVSKQQAMRSTGKKLNSMPLPYTFLEEGLGSSSKEDVYVDYVGNSRGGASKKKSSGQRNRKRTKSGNDTLSLTEKASESKNSNLGATCSSIQQSCWKLIMNNGVSSATYIPMDIDDLFISATATYQGCKKTTRSELSDSCLATKIPKNKSTCNKSESAEQEALIHNIRKSLVSLPATRLNNLSDVPGDQYVPIKVNKTLERISSKVELEISDSDLLAVESFIVSLDLLNTYNQIVDNTKIVVNHGQLKRDFVDISEPPSISVIATENKSIQIAIKQIDNDASMIKVFKKQIDYNTLLVGSQYTLVDTVYATSDDSETILYDSGPGSMSTAVVYRAVSYSNIGASGAFSDAVFKLSDIVDAKQESETHHGCLSAKNLITGIGVGSATIVGEPVNVQIIKRNLSRHEKDYEVIYDPTHPDLSGKEGKSSEKSRSIQEPSVLDTNVHDGEIYEYRTKSLFLDGSEKISCSCIIVEYKYPSSGLSMSTSIPAAIKKGSSSKQVAFNISFKDSTINDEQFIKSFFEANDLAELYSDEIKSMKNELSQIFAANVTRKDMTTGIEVDFGAVQIGSFTDKGQNSTGMPRRDRSYEYTIEGLVRDPEFLLEEMRKGKGAKAGKKYREGRNSKPTSDASSQESENPNYRSKFFARDTLETSTIMNTDALLTKKAAGSIGLGRTGVTKTISITGSRTIPTVTNGSARYNRNEQVVIDWSLKGTGKNSYSVDYFIISATRLGSVMYPVLVCHGQLKGNKFTVVDDTQSDMVGSVSYTVTPVFDDFSLGESASVGKVLIT